MLMRARIPPRPMVPKMDSGSNNSSKQEIVASLIQRYEEDLVNVVKQERQRKHRLLGQMKERATRIMELKEQTDRRPSSTTLVHESSSASTSNVDSEQHYGHPKAMPEDTEDDDIMEDDTSNPSSPEGGRSHDGGMDCDDDADTERQRKRRPSGEHEGTDTSRKLVKDKPTSSRPLSSPVRLLAKPTSLTQPQLEHVQNEVSSWEKSKSFRLIGNTPELQRKVGLQTWLCDSLSISSLKNSADSMTSSTMPSVDNGVLHVFALTGTGLHYFPEEQRRISTQSTPSRNMEHWSLIEVDDIQLIQKEHSAIVQLEMCGLVSRGRDLFGEQVAIELPKESAQSLFNATKKAHNGLMRHLRLRTRFEGPAGRTAHHHVVEKNEEWIDSTLRMWSRLFNVDEQAFEAIEYSIGHGTFTLKPVQESRKGYTIFAMGTIMRTLRDYDQCLKVRFEDVQVLDDGWKKPELIKELKKMSREMRLIDRWNFAGCGWSSQTVKGFLEGLGQTTGEQTMYEQDREPCARISLTRNDFGGEDLVGHLLARCLEQWTKFKTLDLTDCNIGLAGMEALVGKLYGMHTIRLQGNCADHRWWQWVDTILANNQSLHKCRLGAPIAPPMSGNSLVSAGRLSKLEGLSGLDLTSAPVNQATIAVLDSFVSAHSELMTLALPRCELSWSSLAPLFKTICTKNKSKKFTLDISQNPLFDSEESIQDWVRSIEENGKRVGMTPFGIKMQGLIIRDAALRRVLKPLEQAVCFNELNVKGLLIKRESQVTEPKGLSYDRTNARAWVEDASEETCRGLGRVISMNKTLVMLDVSGTEVDHEAQGQASESSSSSGAYNARRGVVVGGQSIGGFGRRIISAFDALRGNETLRVLTMDHNRFREEGMEVLAAALKSNTGLGVLSCDGNDAFTHKALKAIEKVFRPSPASVSSHQASPVRTYMGALEDLQSAEYNSTLSVWKFKSDEILMHKDLLSMEVQRLMEDFHRIESMQVSNREREAKLGPPGGGGRFISEASLLANARELYQNAFRNRAEYMDTYTRIVRAIEENNKRTKEVYERKRMEQSST